MVYDVTDYQSFINLKDWLQKIREFSDRNVIIVLVANKADLVDDDDREKGYGKYKNSKQILNRSKNLSSNNYPPKDHGYFSDPERESGYPFE